MKTIRVFVNQDGEYGNPVGVFEDAERELSDSDRFRITNESGYSEVVFIDSVENSEISIYSPSGQIPFAGHAAVGLAYYWQQVFGYNLDTVKSMDTEIFFEYIDNDIFARVDEGSLPDWKLYEIDSVDELEALDASDYEDAKPGVYWSWIDRDQGRVRARTLAHKWSIPEDEANGSGCIVLSQSLDRELEVLHGKGSVIKTRRMGSSSYMVGGCCKMV